MQRLPPILPISRIRKSKLEEEREPDGRELGGGQGRPREGTHTDEVTGDTVTLRSRVQDEPFEEEEEERASLIEPVPQDSLDGAVRALGATPAAAQAAQGPGVDRNNVIKILQPLQPQPLQPLQPLQLCELCESREVYEPTRPDTDLWGERSRKNDAGEM